HPGRMYKHTLHDALPICIDSDKHALAINKGQEGILHGTKMYLIQDENGQIELAHSISAGLDYPGVGPEHSYYHDIGRVKYECSGDRKSTRLNSSHVSISY